MKTTLTCLIASGLLLGAMFARGATVPGEVNYQGQLLSAAGQPLATGNYTLTFTIYNALSGGSAEWGPYTNTAVAVVDGSFNVVLPAQDYRGTNFVDTVSSSPRYLELKVGDNPPIAPRQQLLSAPYALNADRLQGYDWGGFFDNSNPTTIKIPGGRIADASITAGQLADGAVSAAKIDPTVGVWNKSGNNISYNGGRIGIGTATPDSHLDIEGVLKLGASRDYWSTIFHNLYWGGDSPTWRNTAQGPGTLVSMAGGANHPSAFLVQVSPLPTTEPPGSDAALISALRIVSNGNVGIGAWDPASKLDVRSGPGRQISANEWVDLSGSSSGSGLLGGNMYLDAWPTAFKYSITHASIGAMGFAVNYPVWNQASVVSSGTSSSTAGQEFTPSVIATFTSGGNVGIGTTSPSYKLQVEGSFRATTAFAETLGASAFSCSTIDADQIVADNGVTLEGHQRVLIGQPPYFYYGYSDPPRLAFQSGGGLLGASLITASIELLRDPQRLSITNAGLAIGGGLWVTNMSTGSGSVVYWNAASQQLVRSSSSLRYKQNIEPLRTDFSRILDIEPKQYARKNSPGVQEIGYIAEELDAAGLTACTVYDAEGRPDDVDYSRLIVYSNEILKDQQKRLETQEQEIQSLRGELESMKSLMRELSQRMQ